MLIPKFRKFYLFKESWELDRIVDQRQEPLKVVPHRAGRDDVRVGVDNQGQPAVLPWVQIFFVTCRYNIFTMLTCLWRRLLVCVEARGER